MPGPIAIRHLTRHHKLGRKPHQTLMGVPHVSELALPSAPAVCDRFRAISCWPMLKNDVEGDCTIAAAGHIMQLWNVLGGIGKGVMTDAEAEGAYSALGGFIPGQASTDNGLVMSDVLQVWQAKGLPNGGSAIRLTQFFKINPGDVDSIERAINELGAVYLGYHMPSNAIQTQHWAVDPTSWLVGDHCIPAVGYSRDSGTLWNVSWGAAVPVDYQFHLKYCEEAWAVYSTDWRPTSGPINPQAGGAATSQDKGALR